MAVELHGYQYSVYSWIARLALHEKGVAYSWVEIDPFAENIPASYLARMAKILERRKRLYFTGRSSLPERRVEATGSKAASATSSISQSHRAESEFRD